MSKLGQSKSVGSKRADYIHRAAMNHILVALTPENRLAIEVAMETGLRIGDVLSLKTSQLLGRDIKGRTVCRERITVQEHKTGKKRRVYLPIELRGRLMINAGEIWVFEGRHDRYKHRTRQAVAKDIKRARAILRLPKSYVVSAHSARKLYAVELANKKGVNAVKRSLLHSDETITELYAMADMITNRMQGGKRSELYK